MSRASSKLHAGHDLPPPVAAAVDARWQRAQEHWAPLLLLGRPVHDASDEAIAKIHLGSRQIALNGDTILEKGLLDCVEALLAHEIGHHLRYPGTLAVAARLALLERQLVPIEGCSFSNLFTDLLINEELGHTLRGQLIEIYRAFHASPGWGSDSSFLFYMAIYEELWRLAPGTLMTETKAEAFGQRFPEFRAEAHVVAQDLFRLGPNLYTQFIYFVSVVSRYLTLPKELADFENGDPLRCGHGQPSADDWADALTPSSAEREAVEHAQRKGWIGKELAGRLLDQDAIDQRIAGLPGQGTADAELVPEVMAAYYRKNADRYLVQPPPRHVLGEAIIPTVLEEWDVGDPVADIDWPTTLRLRGERIGGVSPLRRERIAEEEGYEAPVWQRKTELYLDVSGSMPDPRRTLNAMTLASQILTCGTIRADGWVRALLYSSAVVRYWEWCRSEAEISRFLMHYIGGGTEFPFDALAASVDECNAHQPIRVVITDSDFDRNYDSRPENAGILAAAARRSTPLVLLLHRPRPKAVARYRKAGASVVEVAEIDDFPRLAADLTRALFDEERS